MRFRSNLISLYCTFCYLPVWFNKLLQEVGRVWGDFRRYADQRDPLSTGIKRARSLLWPIPVTTEARNGPVTVKSEIPPRTPGDLRCWPSGDKVPADLRPSKSNPKVDRNLFRLRRATGLPYDPETPLHANKYDRMLVV